MARLIDADWLLNAIEKLKVRNTSNTATIFDVLGVLDDVEKIIKAAPINEPVKHGHWSQYAEPHEDGKGLYICSVCNEMYVMYDDEYKFCPSCGAKMDKKEE